MSRASSRRWTDLKINGAFVVMMMRRRRSGCPRGPWFFPCPLLNKIKSENYYFPFGSEFRRCHSRAADFLYDRASFTYREPLSILVSWARAVDDNGSSVRCSAISGQWPCVSRNRSASTLVSGSDSFHFGIEGSTE